MQVKPGILSLLTYLANMLYNKTINDKKGIKMTKITVQQAIYNYLTEILPEIEMGPNLTLIGDLGLDSLDIVEMTMTLEEKLDIVINDGGAILESETVGELVAAIKNKYKID